MTAVVEVALGPASATAVLALPSRAGGGNKSNAGRSSVGRSSSSGSSSRSSSSGFNSGPTYRSTSTGGSTSAGGAIFGLFCLLVIVLIVVAAALALRKRSTSSAIGSSASGPPPPSDGPPVPPPAPLLRSPETQAALDAIRQRDPAFDEDGFLNGVAISFQLVQKAWCDQTPSESRKVMADGIWVSHKQKIEEMAGRRVRNVLEDLHIGRSEIKSAHTDADSDSIVVRIHAYSRDYEVDAENRIVGGDRVLRLWTEDWTFTRSSSATTKQGSGTRQTCPNCGAPLNLDNAGVCGYCREMVMGGKHDWVLSRIEQVYDS